MGAIKPSVEMDYPRKDGTTLRQHYVQLGKFDWIEEKTPEIPPEGDYLWGWFWDIIGGKGSEEGLWSCLRAWSEMTRISLSMWEVEVIKRLHNEYQHEISKKMREK